MAETAQRDAARSRQQLAQTIASAKRDDRDTRASAPGATQSPPSNSQAADPPPSPVPAPASASSGQRSARAYFWIGIVPTAGQTRNPLCYSTPFTITFEHGENGYGDNGHAQDALTPLKSDFTQKCGRHGQVHGPVDGMVEGLTSGFPIPTPNAEDFVVPMP